MDESQVVEVYLVGTSTMFASHHVIELELDDQTATFELDPEHHDRYESVTYPLVNHYFKVVRNVPSD